MMILFKVARLESNPEHEDSLLDVAGYVACLANIIGKSAPKNAQTNASKVSHEEATKAYGWTQNKSTSTLGCLGGLS